MRRQNIHFASFAVVLKSYVLHFGTMTVSRTRAKDTKDLFGLAAVILN